MIDTATQGFTDTGTNTTTRVIYEQPLNETVRLCLRIESLQKELLRGISSIDHMGDQVALSALIRFLNVIDRPDLKSKLTQVLSQQATTLAQLENIPQVDKVHLYDVLGQLDSLLNQLHGSRTKLGHELRQHPFLTQVSSQANNPAGLCQFAIPAYAQWLNQSAQHRSQQLKQWLHSCRLITQSVELILMLTRDSTPFEKVVIDNGFYQQALDPSLPCQLVRIRMPAHSRAYPEVSVGKHHLSARFMMMDYASAEPSQAFTQVFEAELACCRL